MKDNLLFVSKLYPEALLSDFVNDAKVGLDFAAHNLSMAIWTGFKQNGIKVDVLNTPQLGSWPKFHNTPFIREYVNKHLVSVSYFNLMYFKRKSLENHVYKYMYKWCVEHDGDKKILLYNFNYLGVAKKIKRKFPDVKFCMIVTDLPEYMSTSKGLFATIVKTTIHYQDPDKASQYDAIDGFILLAKDMKNKMPIDGKPWIQIEGIYNDETVLEKVEKDIHKVIMYTGNLGSRYGIPDLLKAFMMIDDPDYRLWIRGNGECEYLVKECAKQDSRIRYFDKMSRKELTNLQQRATIMINPVHSSEEFSHYFFPSKTLEYLASGTPTLMSRLSCMPPEYENHLFYFEDESVQGMANRIKEICEKSKSELNDFGLKASMFIKDKKSPKVQIKKIMDFYNTI